MTRSPGTSTGSAVGTPTGPAYERWDRRAVGVLAVLVALNELAALGWTLVLPGLSQMGRELGAQHVAWIVTAYTLSGAVAAPLVGKLGDVHGRRRLLAWAGGCFGIGSLVVAVSPGFGLTVVGRVVQGVGLALPPLSYAVVRDLFAPRLAVMAISVATTGLGAVSVGGPLLAGALIDGPGYRAVFWLLGLLGLLAAVVVGLLLRWVPEPRRRGRAAVDWIGALTFGGGCALILLWLSSLTESGWGSGRSVVTALGAGLLIAGWWGWDRRVAEPLVRPQILARRRSAAVLGAAALMQACTAGATAMLPGLVMTSPGAHLGYGFGDSALGVSRYQVPSGLATLVGGFLVGRGRRRSARQRAWFAVGALSLVAGCLTMAVQHTTRWAVVVAATLTGLGAGICFAALANLVVGLAAATERGVLAGTAATLQSVGAAIGVQIAFAVLASTGGFTAAYAGCAAIGALAIGAILLAASGPTGSSRKVGDGRFRSVTHLPNNHPKHDPTIRELRNDT